MKDAARAYYASCAALIAFAIGYTLPIYAHLPRTYYDPVVRRWFFAANSTPIPMGYIGQILWGIGTAMLAGAVTLFVTQRRATDGGPSERGAILGAAWALTAVAIVIGYFTWNNWP